MKRVTISFECSDRFAKWFQAGIKADNREISIEVRGPLTDKTPLIWLRRIVPCSGKGDNHSWGYEPRIKVEDTH